jgi:hypothetical protein
MWALRVALLAWQQPKKWSPWAALDPNAKYTIEGPEFGVGAKQSWIGDPKTVGSGSQEIVEVKPGESVTKEIKALFLIKVLEITEQTYYRWRKEYGGLKIDQAKRLREMEKENARLRRLVAEQALDMSILREASRGNS